jgi:RNA polymerase sigma factor (sigma-70 family)
MSDDRFRLLSERLNGGDPAAAEEVVRSYEPYLRMVVRRQLTPRLRAKFDSIDVVQSIWANVLRGLAEDGWEFPDEAHLRAFLFRLTLNRFISLYRQHRNSLRRERSLAALGAGEPPQSREDHPSEVVQANELWERLMAIASPSHRELLMLKSRGASLAEISERTGLHPSSVRRILYELEDRYDALEARERDAEEAACVP